MTRTIPGAAAAGESTAVLPLLADPQRYVACGHDLGLSASRRAYWLGLFRKHFASLVEEAIAEATDRGESESAARRRCDAAAKDFYAYLDEVAQQPQKYGRLDILAICIVREQILRHHGFEDPYRLAKARENIAALHLLPTVLRELDQLPLSVQAARVIEGILAGNIFDLGAPETLGLFRSKPGQAGSTGDQPPTPSVDFFSTRSKLKPRPWLIDDLDPLVDRLTAGRPHDCALLFVDNAGSDVVLGMIPLARYLLRRGSAVILSANSTPSLNDATHAELTELVRTVAEWDQTVAGALAHGQLELIPSGNGYPLIDLSRCSRELVAAVNQRGVDFVVLEGMGRSLETNFEARFVCDALKIAMIKDPNVAEALGGQVYDLVVKFEPGP